MGGGGGVRQTDKTEIGGGGESDRQIKQRWAEEEGVRQIDQTEKWAGGKSQTDKQTDGWGRWGMDKTDRQKREMR